MTVLLEARGLTKSFLWRGPYGRAGRLVAVDHVDLALDRGECIALVGESGSGKTTLGQCLVRLVEPDSGEVYFDGEDILRLGSLALRRKRLDFQMVFQDSGSAFDPRFRVRDVLEEALEIRGLRGGKATARAVTSLLAKVELGESVLRRFPHQLSGGQRQRLGIARALAIEPRLVVLDEPVAALDVSVQAQVLDLLARLRDELGLAMVFISHDLAVVQQIAERVAVLYLGRLVELASREEIFSRPQHPYTASLLAAVPVPDPARRAARPVIAGEIPSPLRPPAGCTFHPRCPRVRDRCRHETPALRCLETGAAVACHFPGETEELSPPDIVG